MEHISMKSYLNKVEIFIQGNAHENVVCEKVAILSVHFYNYNFASISAIK